MRVTVEMSSVFEAGLPTVSYEDASRSGPAAWKPLVGIAGPAVLPVEFDAA
jgi:hypothetical protein